MSYEDPDDGWGQCHFCGTYVKANYEDKEKTKPHFLVDCRPDLVEHEVGELCTWPLMKYSTEDDLHSWSNERVDKFNLENMRPGCYAYRDPVTGLFTALHIYFYPNDKLADA